MINVNYWDKGMYQENTYVVNDTETGDYMIIDPGYFDNSIRKAIPNEAAVKYIIATHGHHDHIYALDDYKKAYPNAQFMFCENDRFLANGVAADKNLIDGDVIAFGNTEIKVISTPGHTPGGLCFLIDDILFSGDTLFLMSVGRTDLPGGDWEQLHYSITKKLFLLPDDTKVYPGHGDPTTIGFEKKANPYV